MPYYNKTVISLPVIIISMLTAPLFSFSQSSESDQLLKELSKARNDTGQVFLLLKLGQHYLSKTGKLSKEADSALYFADKAFTLSNTLHFAKGKNVAGLLKGKSLIRKNSISSAISLLTVVHDSCQFILLTELCKYYLVKETKSGQKLDSATLFFERAYQVAISAMPDKWTKRGGHANRLFNFDTVSIELVKKLYVETTDKIRKTGNENSEAILWHDLAHIIPTRDTIGITRLYCLEKALFLFRKAGMKIEEIDLLKCIADLNLLRGKLDLAENQLLDVLQRYKAIGFTNLHYTYDLLTVTYRNKGELNKALLYGLKALESMEATHDSASARTFYHRLATIYRELGQPEKSVEWYRKVLRGQTYSGPNNLYMFRDAGFFARELIKLKKGDEALQFTLSNEARTEPIGVYAEASLLSSLAYCYHALGQDEMAEKYYLKLIKLTDHLEQDNEITTDVHYELGQYFMDKQQYEKASVNLNKALNAFAGINSLSVTKDIYLMLYKSDSAMGNYLSAIRHLMKHKILNDSIFNETKSRQIEELQVQYETAKKQKDIESLNNQNELQQIRVAEANKAKNITLAAVVLLLVIIGLMFNRYLIKQRSNRKLEVNQRELDQKNIFLETLNAEQDKLLKEKEWLIREVHHRVKNNLQMVTSLLNTQTNYLQDEAAILAVKDSLRRMQVMSLIHKKLYQDENISSIGMPDYINELVRYLHESFNTGNRIVFEQTIEPLDLDVSQAIPLGLIINESIVNAIKYAFPDEQAGKVSISLQHDGPDHLLLSISDNGIGLPAGLDIVKHNSLGLDLVQGLAKQLNGSLHIENNKGVHIKVKFIILNK